MMLTSKGGSLVSLRRLGPVLLGLALWAGLWLSGCGSPTTTPAPPTEQSLPIQPSATAAPAEPAETAVPAGVFDPRDLAAFDFVIEKKIEAVPLAGVSLAIRWGSNPIYLKGYGYADLATSTAASGSTVYQIASLTKQFTAAAVMQLVEQGQLALDDPVSRFFPDVPDAWQAITVHHLLNHTSGLPEIGERAESEVPAGRASPDTGEQLIAALYDAPLWFEPGAQFKYGNAGYQLLAAIVEEVTGQAIADYVREQLLAAAGLEDTFPCREGYEAVAQGYQIVGGEAEPALVHDPSPLIGASGLCSTASDLIGWQQALAGGEVVSAESYQTMIEPTVLADGTIIPYGYALGVGNGAVGHGGSVVGFRSWMVNYPQEDLTVVLLSNTDIPPSYALDTLAEVIADRILEGAGP